VQSLDGPLFHPAFHMGVTMPMPIYHAHPHFLYLDETVEEVVEMVEDGTHEEN